MTAWLSQTARPEATGDGINGENAACYPVAETGPWSLAAFAFVYGVFYGGWVALLPAVIMDHFGGRNVSGIIGIFYTSVAFGTLIGPSAAGFAFDVMWRHATHVH